MTRDEPRHLARSRPSSSAIVPVGVLVVVFDRHWRVVTVNQAFEQASGHQADELVGRHFWDLFPSPIENGTGKNHLQIESDGSALDRLGDSQVADGARCRPTRWSKTVLLDDAGATAYVAVSAVGSPVDAE